jgi:DNA-directed RNA polymerase specialized sigma24 family protein
LTSESSDPGNDASEINVALRFLWLGQQERYRLLNATESNQLRVLWNKLADDGHTGHDWDLFKSDLFTLARGKTIHAGPSALTRLARASGWVAPSLVMNPHEFEEFVHDLCVRQLEEFENQVKNNKKAWSPDGRASPVGYFRGGMARNLANRYRSWLRTHRDLPDAYLDDRPAAPGTYTDVDQATDRIYAGELLRDATPLAARGVQHLAQGLTYGETAKILGCHPDELRQDVTKLRQRARQQRAKDIEKERGDR